jgi:BirA family biotin operon repressor/biotin-[acetyl-CoA-carboxylase] ligase
MMENLPFSIKARLKTKVIGREIVYVEETDSTNSDAFDLATKGVDEGWVVIAERQRSGKGRRGKIWSSPGGQNIYLSVVLRPDVSSKKASLLNILAAVSVAETLDEYIPKGVSIKWPNDIMVNGKKISGILLEMGSESAGKNFYILGIGIDINCSKRDLPGEVSEIATSLYIELGYIVSIQDVLFKLFYHMDNWYGKYTSLEFDDIIDRFRAFCETTGKRIRIEVAGRDISGTAVGIDGDGFLIVEDDDGGIHKAVSGDLSLET